MHLYANLINNIFKTYKYPVSRFLLFETITILKIDDLSYISIYFNINKNFFYKIPFGSNINNANHINKSSILNFICLETGYFITSSPIFMSTYNIQKKKLTDHTIYKPVYFERFKYVGKGFKLIFKKKKKIFNCVFGYSHIYWIKIQQLLIKRTKKYKHIFLTSKYTIFLQTINILKKIKPINRYTLRGVRTYTHIWHKRKGRKSVATHV